MARRLLPLLLFGGVFALLSTAFPETAHAYRIPVNIESVPPGATVYLDSTSNPPLGTTPLRNVRIDRGSHTIIFQLANHEEARLQVTVRRRRETFRAVLRALGTIEVSAGNEGARGGSVYVDGRAIEGTLGGTPIRVTDLQPGRHQVRVEREGYDTFEQWVEVGGGQLVRVAAVLQQSAPDTGSILVSGPPGAPVFVDGNPSGTTPTVIDDVAVGSHTVEIRPPGQQPYSQSVTVLAGQRVTVAMPQAGGATLRVLASAPGAVISIDGEVIGPSPASRDDLAAGEHIVEATAEGYQRATRTVTVEAGQSRVISLEMEAEEGEAGRIVVEANVDGATVLIDGEERGQAPVVITPEPGAHAIVVRADGHQEFSTTCETGPGQNCEVDAVLVPQQVRVRVAVQPGIRDAELLVDGEVAGPVPYDGTLPAGSHVITVRAPGHEEYRQQVLLQPSSEVRPFDITLPEITDGLSESERQELVQEQERRYAAAVTHSAAPLPTDQATLDLSIGWPYLAEIRLNVGLLDFLDAGFAIRSFGRLTEFEGRVRAGYRPLEQLAVGGQVRFGGGIGPELDFRDPDYPEDAIMDPSAPGGVRPPNQAERYDVRPETPDMGNTYGYPINSLFLSLELMGSLHFADQGAFTLWFGVDFSSDEYAGHPLNSGTYLDYYPDDPDGDGSTEPYCVREASSSTLSCPREDFARARLGGSLELVLTRNWNLWFMLEGILSSQPRRIMGNLLGIEANDTQFYFRIGTTHKF
ncbi:MAG TPA: PEGA domain-containing protein [Sandaracinaceae bacterium LLY-WYZ-13_1]|nr:PEGA domain-containing protein [Sandaracinaceae bacterium LLY-WYZ-13_1]